MIQLIFLTAHLYLSIVWSGVDLKIDTKRHVFHRDWTKCSLFDNHYRLGKQHSLGEGGVMIIK